MYSTRSGNNEDTLTVLNHSVAADLNPRFAASLLLALFSCVFAAPGIGSSMVSVLEDYMLFLSQKNGAVMLQQANLRVFCHIHQGSALLILISQLPNCKEGHVFGKDEFLSEVCRSVRGAPFMQTQSINVVR